MNPDFETQARAVLIFFREYCTGVYQGVTKYDDEVALHALTALHQSAVQQAQEAVLDRVEKEVIGENDDLQSAADFYDQDLTYEIESRNQLRAEQRQRLGAIRKEGKNG